MKLRSFRTAAQAFLVGVVLSRVAVAGPYEDGLAALESGRYDSAIEILLPLAEEGNGRAQLGLAEAYIRRRGYNDDTREAKKWLQLAADQGFPEGQYGLGWIYTLPLFEDYPEAAKWYRLAAEQGFAPAQVALGRLLTYGFGVPRNHEEAFQWQRRAAEQGMVEAYISLSEHYAMGRGVAKDPAEAFKWMRLAAEQGRGYSSLAHMYEKGNGVPQDNVQAYMWYELASAQGDKSSAIYRDTLAAKMTQEQIVEAQRLARDWLASHPQ